MIFCDRSEAGFAVVKAKHNFLMTSEYQVDSSEPLNFNLLRESFLCLCLSTVVHLGGEEDEGEISDSLLASSPGFPLSILVAHTGFLHHIDTG